VKTQRLHFDAASSHLFEKVAVLFETFAEISENFSKEKIRH